MSLDRVEIVSNRHINLWTNKKKPAVALSYNPKKSRLAERAAAGRTDTHVYDATKGVQLSTAGSTDRSASPVLLVKVNG